MEQNSGTLGNWKISSAAAESGDAFVFRNSMPYADPALEDKSEPVAILPAQPAPVKLVPFANKSRDVSHLDQLDEEERGGTVTNQSLEQSGQQTNQRKMNN